MILRPIAFRIQDYKAIRDSGVCSLSADGITVLAGQNEAGKTSVLKALDDFNTPIGEGSASKDFVPDHAPEAEPTVSILFTVDWSALEAYMRKNDTPLPEDVAVYLHPKSDLWISRTLLDGGISLDEDVRKLWPTVADEQVDEENDGITDDVEGPPPINYATFDQFADALYRSWPIFVYFDSFDDVLPREVPIGAAGATKGLGPTTRSALPSLPRSVRDFVKLANIDLEKVRQLAELPNEKQLRNYLNSKSAFVTGEFLGHWKQNAFGQQKVRLRAEHFRRDGELFLAFYADDGTTMQFPDQRSKGFSWFLSFYLRLAASVIHTNDRLAQLILVDEPGSFLHQKAQADILDVLEKRIVKHDIIIYSSHSPYMMPPAMMHRVRIVAKDEDGSTFIADRLTDERIQRDDKGDALSPVMAAIGLDVGMGAHGMHKENFVVEGITDYYYLNAWDHLLDRKITENRGVIAAKGTKNIPNIVSLCLAWSRSFAILVDRDSAGVQIANELQKKMNISKKIIVHPKDALTIEDVFSTQDFKLLLSLFDAKYKLEAGQSPSSAIKAQNIDKVLLARCFAESVQNKTIILSALTQKTKDAAASLLETLEEALKHEAVFRFT